MKLDKNQLYKNFEMPLYDQHVMQYIINIDVKLITLALFDIRKYIEACVLINYINYTDDYFPTWIPFCNWKSTTF